MNSVNKIVVAIRMLTLTSCAVVLSVSGAGRNQGGSFKRELPAPTGKFAAGRTSFHWVDASRPEAMTDDPNDRRELMVTIWYPAESATGEPAPYGETALYIDNLDRLAGAIDQDQINIARTVQTHSIAEAKISSS